MPSKTSQECDLRAKGEKFGGISRMFSTVKTEVQQVNGVPWRLHGIISTINSSSKH
jgi:hypothetical protein